MSKVLSIRVGVVANLSSGSGLCWCSAAAALHSCQRAAEAARGGTPRTAASATGQTADTAYLKITLFSPVGGRKKLSCGLWNCLCKNAEQQPLCWIEVQYSFAGLLATVWSANSWVIIYIDRYNVCQFGLLAKLNFLHQSLLYICSEASCIHELAHS